MDSDGGIISKEMASSLAEFHRCLARFRPGLAISEGQCDFVLLEDAGEVRLEVEELPAKTMGQLLSLPQLRLVLRFDGFGAEERAAFLGAFDKAFQRGGG